MGIRTVVKTSKKLKIRHARALLPIAEAEFQKNSEALPFSQPPAPPTIATLKIQCTHCHSTKNDFKAPEIPFGEPLEFRGWIEKYDQKRKPGAAQAALERLILTKKMPPDRKLSDWEEAALIGEIRKSGYFPSTGKK